MIRNKYKDDYKNTLEGELKYIGDVYELPFGEDKKRKTGLIQLGFVVLFFGLELAIGLLNSDSSHVFWLLMPYDFLFLPIAYLLIGVVTYMGAPLRMQRATYQGSVIRMKHSGMAILILAGINIILNIVFIVLRHSQIRLGLEIVHLVLYILIFAVGILYGIMYDRMFASIKVFPS